MKSLTEQQRESLSGELRQEIVRDFGRFLEQSNGLYFLESELPWERMDIFLALIGCVTSEQLSPIQEKCLAGLVYLVDGSIPSRAQYEERLQAREQSSTIASWMKAGISDDEIIRRYVERFRKKP